MRSSEIHRRALGRAFLLHAGLLCLSPDDAAGGGAAAGASDNTDGTGGSSDATAGGAPAAPAAPSADAAANAAAAPAAGDPAAPDAGAPAAAAPAAAAAATVPDTYDLKLPEQSTLDASVLERTAATARELGLSQEAAQKLVAVLDQEATTHATQALAALMDSLKPGGAEWEKVVTGWEKEVAEDPKLGATIEERQAAVNRGRAVIDRYAQSEPEDAAAFRQYLDDEKLGSHPAAARFFSWLGKKFGEGSLALPTGNTGVLTEEDKLRLRYPTMYQNQ